MAALREVAEEHGSCAGRIWSQVRAMFPEARGCTEDEVQSIKGQIFEQLEMSRGLLEQHAQGLVGTDLAELRIIQSESKRATDRDARMEKLYNKECAALRVAFEKLEAGQQVKSAPREIYDPLAYLEAEERGCLLSLLEEKMEEIFKSRPELLCSIDHEEYQRLQDLFKKEQLATLEREVARLTERLAEVEKQAELVQAHNEKLEKKVQWVRRFSSDSIRHLQEVRSTSNSPRLDLHLRPGIKQSSQPSEGPEPRPLVPVGKPKAGRPKRGAKYSRPTQGADSLDPP